MIDAVVVDGPCAEEAEAGCLTHFLVEDISFDANGATCWLEDVEYAYCVSYGVAAAPDAIELDGAKAIGHAGLDVLQVGRVC